MREEKNRVRQILRDRKAALLPAERMEKSKQICRHVSACVSNGETVMAYTSKEMEVNTTPLIDMLLERENPVIVPIIVREDVSLRLSYLRDRSVLVPSTFGVPEPIGSEIPATADDVAADHGAEEAAVVDHRAALELRMVGLLHRGTRCRNRAIDVFRAGERQQAADPTQSRVKDFAAALRHAPVVRAADEMSQLGHCCTR